MSGLLLLRWSWRSIFWFLSALTPCCLVPIILVLPETARIIVDDGSVRAHGINRPLIPILVPKSASSEDPTGFGSDNTVQESTNPKPKPKPKPKVNPIASLQLARRPGTALMLLSYALGYATYSCLQASLSTLFQETYDISGLASGLIYIPFGVACALSALGTGRLLDRNYRKTAAAELEAGVSTTKPRDRADDDLAGFPIERARLRGAVTWLVAASACLVASYGWQLQARVSMAGPLATQFLIGLTLQTMFTALSTLLVDVHQDCPSTAQAACNLFRCEVAAGYLAALDVLLGAVGAGWTFVLFAATVFLAVLMLWVVQSRGMMWRQGRVARQGSGGGIVVTEDNRMGGLETGQPTTGDGQVIGKRGVSQECVPDKTA